MTALSRTIAATGLAFAMAAFAASAGATTYFFKYTTDTGQKVTGSFTGTASGSVIDVTGVDGVDFNGSPMTGPLYAYSYDSPVPQCDYTCWNPGTAVASYDPSLNNFLFINTPSSSSPVQGSPNNFSNYFYIIPWSNGNNNPVATQALFAGTAYDNYNGNYIPGNWSLAVPEPATWAMMLFGVGMIGAGLRIARRKNDTALTAA